MEKAAQLLKKQGRADPASIFPELQSSLARLLVSVSEAATEAKKDAALLDMFGSRYTPGDGVSCKRQRSEDIVARDENGDPILGLPSHFFAIRGRSVTIKAFLHNTAENYETFQTSHDRPGVQDQLRREMLFQYGVATPGVGKTTCLKEMGCWIGEENLHDETYSPAFKQRLNVLVKKGLFFYHNFKDSGPYDREYEYCRRNVTVLAARMLYSTFGGGAGGITYERFLERFVSEQPELLRQLTPADVLRFIWTKAGLKPEEKGMVVFAWDEAKEAEGLIQSLLSTYVDCVLLPHRATVAGEESPHFVSMVLASTRIEAADRRATPSSRAQSKPLPFTLLEEGDVQEIVLDLMRRLGMRNVTTLPKHVQIVTDLLGGNPRLLEHALSCMSGESNQRIAVPELFDYWLSKGERLERVVTCIKNHGLARFKLFMQKNHPKADLLELVHAHSVINRKVTRADLVQADAQLTWGDLEDAGMVALIDPGLATTGSPSLKMRLPSISPRYYPLVVRVAPLMVHAFQEGTSALSSRTYTTLHQPVFI